MSEKSPNPVHQAEDKYWYFWDELWLDRFGPYSSMRRASLACIAYGEWLESGVMPDAPKTVKNKRHIDQESASAKAALLRDWSWVL